MHDDWNERLSTAVRALAGCDEMEALFWTDKVLRSFVDVKWNVHRRWVVLDG